MDLPVHRISPSWTWGSAVPTRSARRRRYRWAATRLRASAAVLICTDRGASTKCLPSLVFSPATPRSHIDLPRDRAIPTPESVGVSIVNLNRSVRRTSRAWTRTRRSLSVVHISLPLRCAFYPLLAPSIFDARSLRAPANACSRGTPHLEFTCRLTLMLHRADVLKEIARLWVGE
jgi:hypothetical protein